MRSHPARHAVARAATPTTDVANRGSAEPGRRGRRTNRRRNTTIFGAAVTAAALSGRIATDRNGRAFLGGDLARRRRRRGADVVLRLGHRPDRHRLVDSAVALSTTETYQQTTGSTQHSYAISGAFDKHKPVNDGLDSSGKNNGVSFKGIFVRGPRQLATAAKTTDHDAWLNARASSIEAHDTTSTGFGVSWAGPIRELSSGSTASAGGALVAALPGAGTPSEPAGPVTSGNTGKCLDDSQDSSAPGTKAQIWDCNGNADQKWTVPQPA